MMFKEGSVKTVAAIVAVSCVLSSAFARAATSGTSGSAPVQAIDSLLSRYHELGEFNGAALVARDGLTLVNKGYGEADFGTKTANGPETKFLIGSLTKQFTAVLILKLIEMDGLSLDSTLADALPYYRKDTGSKVTVRHLLEHTSGIPSFTDFQEDVQAGPPIREFVLKYCSRDLRSEPGAGFRYNNGGYVILGAVIEEAAGLPYEEALRRYVLAPLGMSSTGLGRREMEPARAAKGHQRREGKVVPAEAADPLLAFSAGGLYSTATDMALWEKVFTTDAILSSESRAILASAGRFDYSCGQRFGRRPVGPDRADREIIFHGGRITGFNTLLLRVPQDRILIVLFNNTDSTRLETMAAGLLEILSGCVPRPPRRALAEEFRAALDDMGAEGALAALRELRRQEGDLTDPEPEQIHLNAYGYELLGRKRLREALAVFAFAAEQFPNSWNAFDSLAESQAALGMAEEAVRNYAKSLELNPANANARQQIHKLKEKSGPSVRRLP